MNFNNICKQSIKISLKQIKSLKNNLNKFDSEILKSKLLDEKNQ